MEAELSMYHQQGSDNLKDMKKSMQLDFAADTKQNRVQNLIGNQELNMLKLASPELEKMLIAQNGMVGTTPTPTQFAYPKYVTDEQEAYARGFVNALADLHHTPEGDEASISGSNNLGTSVSHQMRYPANTYSTLTPTSSASGMMSQANNMQPYGLMPGYTNHSSISRANPPFAPSGLAMPNHMHQMPQTSYPSDVKAEPSASVFADHTVPGSPDSSRDSDSPFDGMSNDSTYDHVENVNRLDSIPVDLEEQEKIKLERKRARNRIAARKCRTRKLERIGRLEEKVADMKSRNNELAQSAHSLQDQVVQLKQQIMEHMKSGCQIMMPEMNGLHMNGMHPQHIMH